MKRCPRCNGPLSVTYREYVSYPVQGIHEDAVIDIEESKRDVFDCDFTHIMCEECDAEWSSVNDFITDAKSEPKSEPQSEPQLKEKPQQ